MRWGDIGVADKKFRYSKSPVDPDIQRLQRETEDNFISKDRDGNIRIDKDIYCKDLITSADSIFIGKKSEKNKLSLVVKAVIGKPLPLLAIAGEIVPTLPVVEELVTTKVRGVAVFVQSNEPSDPQANDIWIKI